jgi:hypothetical protein
MVKLYLIALSLIVCLFYTETLHSQKNEIKCWKVKKGRFEMVGPQGGSIRIKRKNKIQIERYSRQRIRHRFYITWIDDCNYELTLKKSKIKSLINHTEIKLFVSVIEVSKYYYTALIKTGINDEAEKIEIQIK